MVSGEVMEPAAGSYFEGLVLLDVDHMRETESYKPQLYDVVDDGGANNVDNFDSGALPKGKIAQGGGSGLLRVLKNNTKQISVTKYFGRF